MRHYKEDLSLQVLAECCQVGGLWAHIIQLTCFVHREVFFVVLLCHEDLVCLPSGSSGPHKPAPALLVV